MSFSSLIDLYAFMPKQICVEIAILFVVTDKEGSKVSKTATLEIISLTLLYTQLLFL